MMNYYEFISDQYASLFVVHHFQGFFLDKIPLMRKLKWREVASLRGVYGSMSDENKSLLVNQNAFSTLSKKPYVEAGFGSRKYFQNSPFRFRCIASLISIILIFPSLVFRGSLQLTF